MDARLAHDTMARTILYLIGENVETAQLPLTVFLELPSGATNTVTVQRDPRGYLCAFDTASSN